MAPPRPAAKIKGKTPPQMFESVGAFERAHRPQDATPPGGAVDFFVVPRFHACIQTTPSAVDFYFDVLHPRQSWRTLAIRTVFKAAISSRVVRGGLVRAGLLHSVYAAPPVPNVRWADFEVLLGEWQFSGAFCDRLGTVSHVLTHDRNADRLRNEVDARRELAGVVSLPRLHAASLDGDARGWIEDVVYESPPADDRPLDWAQRAMLRAYDATRETARVGEYLDRLQAETDERYAAAPPEVKRSVDALLDLARRSADEAGVRELALARCHGDLNWMQMVGPLDAPVLIDWSESEVCSVFHDLVYSSIRYGRWRNYPAKDYPDMYAVLRDALRDEMAGVPGIFASALVLAEVGVKQHVDHVRELGSWGAWRNHVRELFDSIGEPERLDVPGGARVETSLRRAV
ncbi:hypothetical protein [Rubrivirga litoralis]|uniref:Aminoglycoside phosphotransferase domain-containing protein n=1 Tax=Rubrivirga litoralis TaxID=3075598 RepID=A0ABU3BSE9_9BACT|nr:hypothetical protein [Rubrivirga sp. F394]MDT0632221.1 hypothetical protein [Rubrivirga sp. F394]